MLRRILIIDDNAANRVVLKARLHAACYNTRCATDLPEALDMIRDERPDVVLLSDARLYQSGLLVCDTLRRLPGCAGLPVLALMHSSQPEQRLVALQAGASDVVPSDATLNMMLAQIRCLLRQSGRFTPPPAPEVDVISGFYEPIVRTEPRALVALVSNQNAVAQRRKAALLPLLADHDLQCFTQYSILNHQGGQPDVILICGDESGETDRFFLPDLNARFMSEGVPICQIRAPSESAEDATPLDLGADCLLPNNVSPTETVLRLRRLISGRRQASERRALLQQGLQLALTDPLTGLSNRRHAMPVLHRMLGQQTGPCAVMLLDIDHFKRVNDTCGHPVGDQVLSETALRLRAGLAPDALLARFGGEEFLIATKVKNTEAALHEADWLRCQLSRKPFSAQSNGRRLVITASIGLAVSVDQSCGPEEILRRADDALLSAKREGRNRVRLARPIAA